MDRRSRDSARDKPAPADDGSDAGGADAWTSYRRWLSRDGAASRGRAPAEQSVYSWKGYQNWADRVRQSWKSDS